MTHRFRRCGAGASIAVSTGAVYPPPEDIGGCHCGERLACPSDLVYRGEAVCNAGADGVTWVRLTQTDPIPTAGVTGTGAEAH